MKLPQIIALCGNPLSGKSTAGEILSGAYGYTVADDGLPLRKIAMDYLGLTERQVFTQEGKLETVSINDRDWVVRAVLGEIGNAFEEKFGADVIPIMAHNARPKGEFSVFTSVRREQARYWKRHGALVIEIVNPLAGPSPFEFDRYNADLCDIQILNDGLARNLSKEDAYLDLRTKIDSVMRPFIIGASL